MRSWSPSTTTCSTSPEDIPVLYEKLQEGYDAVFASFPKKAHGFLQNLGSRLVGRLVHRIFDPPEGLEMSAFRLIRRDVVEHVKAYRTSFPYLSGMILSTTHRVANAQVRHDERRYGRSGYTLPKLVRLSFNLLVNYSALPLKAIGWVGMGASLVGLRRRGGLHGPPTARRAGPRRDGPAWRCWSRSSAASSSP